jgi:hypothetical protein
VTSVVALAILVPASVLLLLVAAIVATGGYVVIHLLAGLAGRGARRDDDVPSASATAAQVEASASRHGRHRSSTRAA